MASKKQPTSGKKKEAALEEQPEYREALVEDHVDDESLNEAHAAINYEITSYGADYTVDSLVKRMETNAFFIPPFQRAYVWTQRQASRFIETLLLGLPVPGVFVSKEEGTARHLVIDGQQRLKTLLYFYSGLFRDERFRLVDVDGQWEGKTIDDLSVDDKLRLDDSVIHTTVFQQTNPASENTSVYHVFERINTGGVKLQPQEIRNCVYFGKLTTFLTELNKVDAWRKIYGTESKRLKDQELILRFLALDEGWKSYQASMNEFLNKFSGKHREIDDKEQKKLKRKFEKAISAIYGALGQSAFRPERTINAAVLDAVMVGVSARLEKSSITNATLKSRYEKLLTSQSFVNAYSRSTANEENVATRMKEAIEAFS